MPLHPNNNTEAHAVCTNARMVRVHYLHTYGHLSAAMFWMFCEFTRFLFAKTKRVRRLLLCPVSLPQQGTYPRRELKNFRSHAVWNGIRLQRYNKKMTLANKSAIFMHFCIFLPDFYHRSFTLSVPAAYFMLSIYACFPHSPTRSSAGWLFGSVYADAPVEAFPH